MITFYTLRKWGWISHLRWWANINPPAWAKGFFERSRAMCFQSALLMQILWPCAQDDFGSFGETTPKTSAKAKILGSNPKCLKKPCTDHWLRAFPYNLKMSTSVAMFWYNPSLQDWKNRATSGKNGTWFTCSLFVQWRIAEKKTQFLKRITMEEVVNTPKWLKNITNT